MEEKNVAPLHELMQKTEQAQKDYHLVELVSCVSMQGGSPEAVDKAAEDNDYPTYLCKQARLLAQMRCHYDREWEKIFAHSQYALKSYFSRTHEYPCEWETVSNDNVVYSTNCGTLVVTKNHLNAAVHWDYALIDENGLEICHNRDLGRDWFRRNGLPGSHINCQLNSGSKYLPRKDLVITFKMDNGVLHLIFSRKTGSSTIKWARSTKKDGNNTHPHISREVLNGRHKEHHQVMIRPMLAQEIEPWHPCLPDPWGLFIEKSFLKHQNSDLHQTMEYRITAQYAFALDALSEHPKFMISGKARAHLNLHHVTDLLQTIPEPPNSPISISCTRSYIDNLYHKTRYEPHDQDVDKIAHQILQQLPNIIDIRTTIERLCDLRKTDDFAYNNGRVSPINLLVIA